MNLFRIIFYSMFFAVCSGPQLFCLDKVEQSAIAGHANTEQKQWDKFKYNLAICAIFKNEAPYLKEWIEFHRLVGVEHFYLYNNLSTDNYKEVLKPYIKAKIVDLIEWPHEISETRLWYTIQCEAYTTALKKNQETVKWMALIDIDEFLFPVNADTINEVIQEFEDYNGSNIGGICVNWQLYGTSHIFKIPEDQLLIETLFDKAPEDFSYNHHVKSIVRPEYVEKLNNAHFAQYKKGYIQVDENKVPFSGPRSEKVSVNKLRINHYWTRDEDFFLNSKIASRKKRGWSVEKDLEFARQLTGVIDPIMTRFGPELRQKMGLDK